MRKHQYVALCGRDFVESGDDLLALIRVVATDHIVGESVAIWDGGEMIAYFDVEGALTMLLPVLLPFPQRISRYPA
jgi:hypothetical protein